MDTEFNVDKYWNELPKLIDPDLFDFYHPLECEPVDIYDRPDNNVLALPNEIIEFALDHFSEKKIPDVDSFKLVVISYHRKSFIPKKHVSDYSKDDLEENKVIMDFNTKDEMLSVLYVMYLQRRTSILAAKMNFINDKLQAIFGDKPDLCMFKCCGWDIDKYILEAKIVDRINNVNEIYNVLKSITLGSSCIEEGGFSISELVQIMENNKPRIIARGITLDISDYVKKIDV